MFRCIAALLLCCSAVLKRCIASLQLCNEAGNKQAALFPLSTEATFITRLFLPTLCHSSFTHRAAIETSDALKGTFVAEGEAVVRERQQRTTV